MHSKDAPTAPKVHLTSEAPPQPSLPADSPPYPLPALTARDDLYSAIVMLLAEGVVVQDATGAIVASNPSAERILGLSRDEMLGRTSLDPRWHAIHEDRSPFPGETHPAMVALRTGQPQTGVTMGIHKPDGTLTWILVDAHPLFSAGQSRPCGVVSMFREITAQVVAGERLSASEERYRTLLMLSPDAISITDDRGRILDCNDQFVRMHGADSRAEVIGRNVSEFAPPAELKRLRDEVAAALASGAGRAQQIEVEVLRRDGTAMVTEYSVAPVPWPEAPSGVAYLSLIRDITRRKAAAELARYRERLEELVRERTEALEREVAEHTRTEARLQESNKRLRRLAGYLQQVREDERQRIARELHDELGQELTALKMDLAWLRNKLRTGRVDAAAAAEEVASAAGLVDHAIQSVRSIATELRPDVLDKLGLIEGMRWQAAEFERRTGIRCETVVRADAVALGQARQIALYRILQEALTNVAKHSGASNVTCDLAVEGGAIRLTVRDDGRGITEEEAAASRSLGLLGMRERALQLGGTLQVVGHAEGGTTVEVVLPLDRPGGEGP